MPSHIDYSYQYFGPDADADMTSTMTTSAPSTFASPASSASSSPASTPTIAAPTPAVAPTAPTGITLRIPPLSSLQSSMFIDIDDEQVWDDKLGRWIAGSRRVATAKAKLQNAPVSTGTDALMSEA